MTNWPKVTLGMLESLQTLLKITRLTQLTIWCCSNVERKLWKCCQIMLLQRKAPITHSRIGSRMSYSSWVGWVGAESGWFGVNRSKFVVSRDDSWWFLADRELAPKTLKIINLSGPIPESSRIKHDSWLLRGRVGRNRGSFGWFVALSGKSAPSRGSLVAHSGNWGEICTLKIRGQSRAESGE